MKGTDKKIRILEAAEQLFTRQGVKNTTIEQIAKGAQIGKGTVYLYFKDKEAVVSEVMEYKWRRLQSEAASRMGKGTPFLDNINNLLHEMTRFRASDPFFCKLYEEYRELQTGEIRLGMKNVQLSVVHYIEKVVKEAGKEEKYRFLFPAGYWLFCLLNPIPPLFTNGRKSSGP
ncbi:TetR/AcrR family transcriptional regulator [Paenibacillus larvae]|nr:TetR/AcrR family transcriptional regulator [Paenibacillus larvae]MDT2294124.1 TetR/AcrR family transcriptional regulator [Paenibacillus larvae]